MTEQALSYEQYLKRLPAERRAQVERVWGVVREHMPAGYVEEIDAKFLSFKAGEDWYVALANQKNYISLYLIPLYMFPEMKAKFDAAAASKKLKCGKSCVNFLRAEELPLEVIGEIVGGREAQAFAEDVRRIRSAERPPRKKVKGKD
ncbi:MAG TPA: DUF1801 domain-containing protein [Pyrinomonadaceae bacterium]|nr:DUF1801 domain-containing protein [Pyrinomonadaceae bacterium]